MDRLKVIFVAAAFIVGLLFMWFSSNFFYTLFWAFLERWDFKEANVVAYTLAHITPFILIVLVVLGLYFIVRHEMGKQSPVGDQLAAMPDGAGILLECHIVTLPSKVPPSGRVYLLSTFPIPQENGGGGLIEQFFGSDSGPITWPKLANGLPRLTYSCKLTSYRAEPLFQIQMLVRLIFIESLRGADGKSTRSGKVEIDRTWPIEIAKIEPGANNSFEFFIRNDNDKWVEVRFPNTVSARTLAGVNREIPVIQQTASGVRISLIPHLEGRD
jgi:hypothetical protein